MKQGIPTLVKHIKDHPVVIANLHRIGEEFPTPRHLLEKGIAYCSRCGEHLPYYPGNNWCLDCQDHVLVIGDDITPRTNHQPSTNTQPCS